MTDTYLLKLENATLVTVCNNNELFKSGPAQSKV